MSSFTLKIIACISMLIDHTGHILFPHTKILGYIGRLAFPIFAFQITEGYIHTKNVKKYLLRLLLLAIISQIPFSLAFQKDELYLNTVFTLFLGLLGLTIYNKNKIIGILYIIIATIMTSFINFDYGKIGIILIFCFYIFRDKKALLISSFLILFTYLYWMHISEYKTYYWTTERLVDYYIPYYVSTLFAIPLLLKYNRKEGPKIKNFYYIFYPVHLLVLVIIKYFI